ncbi:hypothetical protein ACFXO9_19725 [Nocardia tengchongensis]|uniref:hypothetical protein n=1 Tax=Nocardia tengchongensis TaxID=2055889 RepID=UPI0036CD0599
MTSDRYVADDRPAPRPRRTPATLADAKRALDPHCDCDDRCPAKSFYESAIQRLTRPPLGWEHLDRQSPTAVNAKGTNPTRTEVDPMDLDQTLALLSIEQPARWLQYRDGSWAPVWESGLVGDSFTAAELHTLIPTERLPNTITPIR